jgi:hypothetical protein
MVAAEETIQGAVTWELAEGYRKAVKACLPFVFAEEGDCWSWHSDRANLTAVVEKGAEKNTLVVKIVDGESGAVIKSWVTELRLTGAWKRRLRQASGEAMVLAQNRPLCPLCKSALRLRERGADSRQFFGCSKFPSCRGSLNVVDHDVEIPQ